MTVENLLSHQFIEDWLSFHAHIKLYCCKQIQKLHNCNLKDIDMSISPLEKFIILTEDVALPAKNFMGKKANLVKFVWFVKYCFCSRLKFEGKCFSDRHAAIFFCMADCKLPAK